MKLTVQQIDEAAKRLEGVVVRTPLQLNANLSEKYDCEVYLKREDQQLVRSYKLRGAYNFMSQQTPEALSKGVVCASAGNHAQGVAYSCRVMKVKGTIFMPNTTPRQKVQQVENFGREYVEIVLIGDTFDDAFAEAEQHCTAHQKLFVHPFDQVEIMEGQGTVGKEIYEDLEEAPDYVFLPIGGGGLCAGVGSYLKKSVPTLNLIGVEPQGAASMNQSIQEGKVVRLASMDKFVDGAAVQQVGIQTFEICKRLLDGIILVPEGKACTTLLSLYSKEAIVVEPAGALSIAALDYYKEQIRGKKIVCIISGGNNDLDRLQEIKDRSLLFEGLKHYLIVRFPQRAGALKEFVNNVLGPNDNITRFEYIKRTAKESGPALVGIEFANPDDYEQLIGRMHQRGIGFTDLSETPLLFDYLV